MRVIKYGTVTLTEGDVLLEGWLVSTDETDPVDVPFESLLLAYAIEWAKLRFQAAVNDTTMDTIRAMYRKGLEIKAKTAHDQLTTSLLDS